MIKVNRNSWHYKLANILFTIGRNDSNLCKYFWEVVISSTISLIIIGLFVSFIYLMIIELESLLIVGLSMSFITLPLIAIILLRATGINTRIETPKQLNLFAEYLKAKKEKICPIIKFE